MKKILIMFIAIVSLMCTTLFVYAESEVSNIPVEVSWQNDDASNRPVSVVVSLYNGDTLEQSLTINSENNWLGEFTNVPTYDSEGNLITYTIKEDVIDNYETQYTQPTLGDIVMGGFLEKVTPASNSIYPLGDNNLVVAKKGNILYVWSLKQLNSSQLAKVLSLAEATSELSGFKNYQTAYGVGASFDISHQGSTKKITIEKPEEDLQINFEEPELWSMFFVTTMIETSPTKAQVLNIYTKTNVISEDDDPTPNPTPNPSPSPKPNSTSNLDTVAPDTSMFDQPTIWMITGITLAAISLSLFVYYKKRNY